MSIKFGTDVSVKGTGPDKDFSVTVTKEVVVSPHTSS